MSVDEARRLLLHDAARTAWGADAALVLMEMLPATGWGDVATRQQLEATETRLGLRIELTEAHLDQRIGHLQEALELRIDARTAEGQRRMLQWMIATMIAMTGVFAAITRLG